MEEGRYQDRSGRARLEEARGQDRLARGVDFIDVAGDEENYTDDKRGERLGCFPALRGGLRALEAEEQENDSADEENEPEEVEGRGDLANGALLRRVEVQEEEEDEGCGATRWKVDPEAPTPGDVIGEDATNERSDNTCDSPRRTDQAAIFSTFFKGSWKEMN